MAQNPAQKESRFSSTAIFIALTFLAFAAAFFSYLKVASLQKQLIISKKEVESLRRSEKRAAVESSSASKPGSVAYSEKERLVGVLQNLEKNAEYRASRKIQNAAEILNTYGALFRHWNKEKSMSVNMFLLEQKTVLDDIMINLRAQGIDPNGPDGRSMFKEVSQKVFIEFQEKIKSEIGANEFERFSFYEKSLPQRNTANLLKKRSIAFGEVLDEDKVDQVVEVLSRIPSGGRKVTVINDSPAALIEPEDIAILETVLTPSQVTIVKSLQAEQRASERISRMISDQMRR